MIVKVSVLTVIVLALALSAAMAQTGNLGYNSYEGALSGGSGLHNYFGTGPGYGVPWGHQPNYGQEGGGFFFRRYFPPEEWGKYGYGTGHLGQGYGPYIFGGHNPPPPAFGDPLQMPYTSAPPPSIKVKNGCILVGLPSWVPGIRSVTVTVLAFNGAELETQCLTAPPYQFSMPVVDGVKNVRVRIDYANSGLSATSYPL